MIRKANTVKIRTIEKGIESSRNSNNYIAGTMVKLRLVGYVVY